jgi:DNA-directed RNA polymerase subunit F
LEERARDEVRNILNAERKEYLTSEQKRKLLEIEKKWCALLIG